MRPRAALRKRHRIIAQLALATVPPVEVRFGVGTVDRFAVDERVTITFVDRGELVAWLQEMHPMVPRVVEGPYPVGEVHSRLRMAYADFTWDGFATRAQAIYEPDGPAAAGAQQLVDVTLAEPLQGLRAVRQAWTEAAR